MADEIDEINSVINIRHIISEYALGDGGDTPLDTRATGMRELCESASSMLERLRELNCTLDELTRELIWTLSHT